MNFRIAVLAGDGIGPEISVQGVNVMTAVCEKFGHTVVYKDALCGAHAIDEVGDPFPEETYRICSLPISVPCRLSNACFTSRLSVQNWWKALISFASAS